MSDDILKEALDAFETCESVEKDNRATALADLKFGRLGGEHQWPKEIRKQRLAEGRPCLTINRMPAFIRQVVNDSRQNKPGIAVHPVEKGDDQTAEVIAGLVRNIEKTSNADIAYDTAVDNAATCGFGYLRVNLDYACDDTFEQDIIIKPVPNPFAVYGDPYSQAADSSDWNTSFVIDEMPEDRFKAKYPKAKVSDFGSGSWKSGWCDQTAKKARVAEYWKRSEIVRELVQWQAEGQPVAVGYKDEMADLQKMFGSLEVGNSRPVKSYKVTQYLMTANEVLETIDWKGRYIPIIPVYGEEVNVEGKRYFRSLIRDARDPQQMFNFWRTQATEQVALASRAPWVGKKGAFQSDPKWATANNASHAFLEYDGAMPPQREPPPTVPIGDIQMALNASDDMKAVLGLYDASLGARSNETSGIAIRTRQHEGDVSTFHIVDNLSRGVRHTGIVVIDLIPHVYSTERVLRVIGEDNKTSQVKIVGKDGEHDPEAGIYNLTLGKYDLSIKAGANYTTQREEALDLLTELVRAQPDAAMILGDLIIELMDIPGGDKAAKRLQAMLPPQVKAAEQGDDPETQAMQQAMQAQQEQFQQVLQQMHQQLQEAQAKANDNSQKARADDRKADVEAYKAVTERLTAVTAAGAMSPEAVQQIVIDTLQDVIATSQDIPEPEGPENMAPMQPMPQGMGQAEAPQPAL